MFLMNAMTAGRTQFVDLGVIELIVGALVRGSLMALS